MIIFIARMHSDDIPEQRSAKHIIVIMKVQSKLLLSFTESSLDPWVDPRMDPWIDEMDHGKLCSETWSSWIHLQNSNVKLMLNDPRAPSPKEKETSWMKRRERSWGLTWSRFPQSAAHIFSSFARERDPSNKILFYTTLWTSPTLLFFLLWSGYFYLSFFSVLFFLEGPAKMHCNCYNCHFLFFSGIQTILWHNWHGGKLKCFNTILFCSTIANHKQLVVCESLVRKRKKINVRTKS